MPRDPRKTWQYFAHAVIQSIGKSKSRVRRRRGIDAGELGRVGVTSLENVIQIIPHGGSCG
jgi:hypothetical protein